MRKATESFEISWFFRFMNIGFINLVSKNYHADSTIIFFLSFNNCQNSFFLPFSNC